MTNRTNLSKETRLIRASKIVAIDLCESDQTELNKKKKKKGLGDTASQNRVSILRFRVCQYIQQR